MLAGERAALAEMAPGEALLDALLARGEPVHGVVELVLVGIEEGELAGDGAGVLPEAGGGELGGGVEQALGDHGEDAVALAGGGGGRARRAGAAGGRPRGRVRRVREGGGDLKDLVGADEGLVAKEFAESLDFLGGPLGEVGESAFADLGTFAPAFAEEDGGGRVAIGDGLHAHGNIIEIDYPEVTAILRRR